jgi:hypothetical protein
VREKNALFTVVWHFPELNLRNSKKLPLISLQQVTIFLKFRGHLIGALDS